MISHVADLRVLNPNAAVRGAPEQTSLTRPSNHLCDWQWHIALQGMGELHDCSKAELKKHFDTQDPSHLPVAGNYFPQTPWGLRRHALSGGE